MQQLILHIEGISRLSPHPWTSRNFTEVEVPGIFVGFISHPLTQKCITNKPRVVATSCSLGSIITVSSM